MAKRARDSQQAARNGSIRPINLNDIRLLRQMCRFFSQWGRRWLMRAFVYIFLDVVNSSISMASGAYSESGAAGGRALFTGRVSRIVAEEAVRKTKPESAGKEGETLAGIAHKCSGAVGRGPSCLPRRHSCRRLPSTLCHNREQVSRRVSTRQGRGPAPPPPGGAGGKRGSRVIPWG